MRLSEAEIAKLRASGIRLDAEGRFWHEGQEVTHAGMRAAFFRWLDREPDGRYVLRLDPDRFVYLEVDDAPYLVRSLRWQGERAMVRLSDGTEEELDYPTLRTGESGIAYATVKKRFDARLSGDAWTALAPRLVEREGAVYLDAGGRLHRVSGQDPR